MGIIIQMGINREKPPDNFSWMVVPNNVIKYFIGMKYNNLRFDAEENCFLTLLKDLNVSRE